MPNSSDPSPLFSAPQPPPRALPHQSPFRLLDRILGIDQARGELWADKRLTAGDALWTGDGSPLSAPGFDQPATLPALLLIEALSQAAACYNLLSSSGPGTEAGGGAHLGFLVSVTDFRFPDAPRDGASPGDTLLLHVKRGESLGPLTAFSARAYCVSGEGGLASRGVAGVPMVASSPSEIEAFEPPPLARLLGHGRLLFAVTSK